VFLQVVGSPIGAYLLLHLDSAHLQLSIAGVLSLVFLSMVVTPAQFKQSWKSLKDKLASHNKAQHAQHEGYSTLPPTPTFGAMHYTDTPKSSATELSQARPLDSPRKGGNIPQDSQILKPSALPVPVVSTSSGSGPTHQHPPPLFRPSGLCRTPTEQRSQQLESPKFKLWWFPSWQHDRRQLQPSVPPVTP
jgi:hypothetical protein